MRSTLSHAALALALLAVTAGCGTVAAQVPNTGVHLETLTGDQAIEEGQLRVKVVDKSMGGTYRLQALPSAWNSAHLRLIGNNTFTNNGGTGNKLTADRSVALPVAEFQSTSGGVAFTPGISTAAQVKTSLFTKLRPGTYLFQISLENTTTLPTTTTADQSVSVTITGGATTNLVVTLQTTGVGSNVITATSAGTEPYGTGNPGTGNLNNSTVHTGGADFAFVVGDTISLASPMQASDSKTNTQSTALNVNATSPVNGTVSVAAGQVSRIVASMVVGSNASTVATAVTNATPTSSEKIVAVWYAGANEARTATAWSAFYGTGLAIGSLPLAADSAAVVGAISDVGSSVQLASLVSAASFTVPDTAAAASGPNGTGVPGMVNNLSELATVADINTLLVYRFYDNTFEHRYIGAQIKKLAVDSAAAIQVTAN